MIIYFQLLLKSTHVYLDEIHDIADDMRGFRLLTSEIILLIVFIREQIKYNEYFTTSNK